MNRFNMLKVGLLALIAVAAIGCTEKAPDVVTTPGPSTTIVKDTPTPSVNVNTPPAASTHTQTNTTTTPDGTATTTTSTTG